MKFPDSVEEGIEAGILKHRTEKDVIHFAGSSARCFASSSIPRFFAHRVISGAPLKGLRIVLDCANGAAYQLGPELFSALGCDIVCIGAEPDGRNITLAAVRSISKNCSSASPRNVLHSVLLRW